MELALTKAQKRYLDKKGFLSASELQKTYRKSVQDQQALLKKADRLRKKNR